MPAGWDGYEDEAETGFYHRPIPGATTFHNGHLEYALQAKSEVDFLIVGVCNPDAKSSNKTTRANPADNNGLHFRFRHQPARNPFTYYERLVMIETALADIGLKSDEFANSSLPD